MMDPVNYEVVKLHVYDQQWVVSYQGDDSLRYSYYEDALISLGILVKELSKIVRHPLRILIFDDKGQVSHENFLFPSLYEENQAKKMKKNFSKTLQNNFF